VIRTLFIFCIVFYPAIVWPFARGALGRAASVPAAAAVESGENGMGGGVSPEGMKNITLLTEDEANAFELSGVPEPKEYSRPQTLVYAGYTVESGDMIGTIAEKTGLRTGTLLSVNKIRNARVLQVGQTLKIPNQDGILYTTREGDTFDSIAEKYGTEPETIRITNEIFAGSVPSGMSLFISGAKMNWVEEQEINGDLFIWPVRGYITSHYGVRYDPVAEKNGAEAERQFHLGIDIGAPGGTPVKAAMSGRVISTGYNDSYGNFVVIAHHSGYRTLYGHLSAIKTRPGAFVGLAEVVGNVGSTGKSTGFHLHFTVYKDGRTMNPLLLMK
jgi:murein DD-endopeptidase MepM/ murein hydrolase activator NlpD